MTMPKERQIALLKVLAAAAWADGKVEPAEAEHIRKRMVVHGLTQEESAVVTGLLDAPVSYSRCEELTRELLAMLKTEAERREVVSELESLLRADGEFGSEEREVLDSLKGVMDAMTTVDGFIGRITSVFRTAFVRRGGSGSELTRFIKNAVLHRLDEISGGSWREKIDADTLNRYTLFGAVLGRVADLDGVISADELSRIRELLSDQFDIQPPLLDWVVQAVEEASTSGADRQGLLSEFNRISGMKERKELLRAAFGVASLSGITAEELRELRTISNFLWFDPRDYNEIRQHYTA
jgi:uncharacterized tellurite resistance protein B-like protein